MKKILIMMLLAFCSQSAFAEDIEVVVNNEIKPLENTPIVSNEVLMLPLKALMDEFGYEVKWVEETREVVCLRGDNKLVFTIGKDTYMNNEHMLSLEHAPMILNERTYVSKDFFDDIKTLAVEYDIENSKITFDESLEYLSIMYQNGDYKHFKANEKDIARLDQVIYKWAKLEKGVDGVQINTTSTNNNTMFYPSGHELVTKPINDRLLNIEIASDALYSTNEVKQIVKSIKSLIVTPGLNEPDFNGIQLHVEAIEDENKINELIKGIKETLPNIDLNVLVSSNDFEKIDLTNVDYLLIDYAKDLKLDDISVNFNPVYVEKPSADIGKLNELLTQSLADLPKHQRNKIVLKIDLDVIVWQGKTVYESKRIDTDYDEIFEHFEALKLNAFGYNEKAQQPYIMYDEGEYKQTLWYENRLSIDKKFDLVKKHDIGGVVFNHIGQLPMGPIEDVQLLKLNILENINE